MSIAPTWCDFKTYCEEIGPGRGRPARPGQCLFCEGERVWFNDALGFATCDSLHHRPEHGPTGCLGGLRLGELVDHNEAEPLSQPL